MSTDIHRAELEQRLDAWRDRLRAWGLDGLAASLLEAAEPLGPIGAQALYVAQPTLRLFMPSETVGRWAELLEDPATVAWMRDRLTGPGSEGGTPDDPGD